MKRRLTYALAAAAVALGIAAGLAGEYPALAGQVPAPPITDPPGVAKYIVRNDDGTGSVAPPPALAGFKTRAGGTEISVSHPLRSTPGVVLAGFNSTKVGTEMAW